MNDDRAMGDPPLSGAPGTGRPGHHGDAVGADQEPPGTETITGSPHRGTAGTDGPAADGAAADGAGQTSGTGTAATTGRTAAQARRRRRVSWWVELIALFAFALVIMLVIKTYVIQAFFIPSSSMENTLDIGDKVLVNKLIYHFRPIDRGDIIVFNGEGSWDPPSPPQSSDPIVRWASEFGHAVVGLFGISPGVHDYIKRVIGLPGDHVACCNAQGDVTVNGVALHEKSYLYPDNPPSQTKFNIRVPPGRRHHPGEPGGRPGVPDHLADEPVPGAAHPQHLQQAERHQHRTRRTDQPGRPGRGGGRRRGATAHAGAPVPPPQRTQVSPWQRQNGGIPVTPPGVRPD